MRLLLKLCKSYLMAKKYTVWSANISNRFSGNYSEDRLAKFSTSLELLNNIESNYKKIAECSICHYEVSLMTTFYQMVALRLLSEGLSINTDIVQEDVRLILSGINGTESGTVPKEMEDILRLILNSGLRDDFISLDKVSGRGWLNLNIPEAGRLFEKFIYKNRHRGVLEVRDHKISFY